MLHCHCGVIFACTCRGFLFYFIPNFLFYFIINCLVSVYMRCYMHPFCIALLCCCFRRAYRNAHSRALGCIDVSAVLVTLALTLTSLLNVHVMSSQCLQLQFNSFTRVLNMFSFFIELAHCNPRFVPGLPFYSLRKVLQVHVELECCDVEVVRCTISQTE